MALPETTPPPATLRSFYADALSEAERADLPLALQVEGVEQEIALLRLLLRRAVQEHPQDLPLMFRGIELLARAVAARYRLSKKAERDFAASIAEVVRGLGDLWPGGLNEA